MNELTHLDLFSGVGGFALAAQWAGFRTVGFSEIEPWCCSVLHRRFPGVPNVGDVRVGGAFAGFRGRVTVLTGGFPCQPWSVAGKKHGADDPRHLWPSMRGVIKVIRPAWVIGENVPQFVSMGGIDNVIDDLENLGYSAQPFIVPACAVGAWHQRERVWIVAHADRKRKQQSQGQLAQGGRWCGNIHTPGNDVPDSAGGGCQRGGQTRQWIMEAARSGEASPDVPDAVRAGREKLDVASVTERQAEGILWDDPVGPAQQRHACWDADFGDVLRMADGVSEGLDSRERNARIRALGNAIVPQVVAPFFRWIAQIERGVMSNV